MGAHPPVKGHTTMEDTIIAICLLAGITAIMMTLLRYHHIRAQRQQEIDKERHLLSDRDTHERMLRDQSTPIEMAKLGYEQEVFVSEETRTQSEVGFDGDGDPVEDTEIFRGLRWVKVRPSASSGEYA